MIDCRTGLCKVVYVFIQVLKISYVEVVYGRLIKLNLI